MSQDAKPLVHVSEVFGPTIQGEGPHTGRACVFVRLGGCNLTCGPCDTPYTWDGKRFDLRREITAVPAPVVAEQVRWRTQPGYPRLVVISGGEPLIHQDKPGLRELMTTLASEGFELHVETNGTLAPASWMVELDAVRWVVSPKLVGPLATDPERRRLVPQALQAWRGLAEADRAHFKIVLGHVSQVDRVAEFARRYGVPRHRVYVMPEGEDAQRVLNGGRSIVEAAATAGFGVSTRLHTLMWPNDRRGR